jgi:hypothetical protein
MVGVHKINKHDLQVGTEIEKSEHSWAGSRTARRIAMDHLQKNPKAYSSGKKCGEGGAREDIIILNQNIKVRPTRPKKKLPPKLPPAPAWQTWGQELL